MRNTKILFALSAVLLLQACGDSDIQKIAKSMLVVAHAVGDAQTIAIQANGQNLIDDQTTGKILSICAKINIAGKQADAVLRSVTKLDPSSRSSLSSVAAAIGQAIDPSQLEMLANIKNPVTRQNVEGGFTLVRSAVSAIEIVLAAGG
jgi:hypothetical protein